MTNVDGNPDVNIRGKYGANLKSRIFVDGDGDVHIRDVNEESLIIVGGLVSNHVYIRSHQHILFSTEEDGSFRPKFYIKRGSAIPFVWCDNNGEMIMFLDDEGNLAIKGDYYKFAI